MYLETERLIIRDWTLEDAEAAFSVYGDPEVMLYVGSGKPYPDRETMRARLEVLIERDRNRNLGLWALELKGGGEVVGGAVLNHLPDGTEVEVGYHLAKKHWGKGYATEATKALLDHGWSIGLTKIVGVTYPENVASQQVLRKAGLVHAGQIPYGEKLFELFVIERS